MQLKSDHYALVIGIDHYANLPSVPNASRDATAFADWLTSDGGLPRENVQLLLSPPEPPVVPSQNRPQWFEIDRALSYFGARSGTRVGQRLYVYFAGNGFVPTPDDVGLLMADAELMADAAPNIGLGVLRTFFRETALFDEVVYIIDYSRVPDGPAKTVPPRIKVRSERPDHTVAELILLGRSPDETASSPAGHASEWRGLLTRAVLEGLNGAAATPSGHVTSASLGAYVREEAARLASESGAQVGVHTEMSASEMVLVDRAASAQLGKLIVEVPHWTADVRIYDSLLRPVANIGPIVAGPKSKSLYISETALSPGIYQVEAVLENHSQRKLVLINPHERHRIGRDEWKDLKLESTAPLAGTAAAREKHTEPAIRWSTKRTWTGSRGDSNLFLFVRTLKKRPFPSFAHGLYLLDQQGNEVANFSEGGELNRDDGWLAFNANLPAGSYILRRARSGVRVRHQPLHLCAGWQTQIFLQADTNPSLRMLTLNMARKGRGFKPNDEAILAADIILDSMRHPGGNLKLLTSERMGALLRGKLDNPWLGILAAYALAHSLGQEAGREASADQLQQAYSLLQIVLEYLTCIEDHPDVRALNLKDTEPSPAPFQCPPLLRAGLDRVQKHATQFAETVPEGCLTDFVFDHLVANAPWTAWREPAVPPAQPRRVPTGSAPVTGATSDWTSGISLLYTATPKAPVFRLDSVTADDDAAADALPEQSGVEAYEALRGAPILQVTQVLAQNESFDTLPDTVPLNPSGTLDDLLREIDPREVSAASGLPLARVTAGLQRVLARAERDPLALTARVVATLPPEEQAVIEFALQRLAVATQASATRPESMPTPQMSFAPGEETAQLPSLSAVAAPTIEGCAGRLRAEIERILHPAAPGKFSPEEIESATALARRLEQVADALLEHCEFVVLTDPNPNWHILSGNAAFVALVAPPAGAAPAEGDKMPIIQSRARAKNVRAWESALAKAKPGRSIIIIPLSSAHNRTWELHRAPVENGDGKGTKAFLNVFRRAELPPLSPAVLKQIDDTIPEISLYAAGLAHGSPDDREEYLRQLDILTKQVEQITPIDDAIGTGDAG